MLCKCSNQFRFEHEHEDGPSSLASGVSRELSAKLRDGEAKLQEGSIREAELSLREALSVNNEEARALLGRLEYDRGNFEAALDVLEGVQGHNFGASLQVFVADAKLRAPKRGRQAKDGGGRRDGVLGTFLHGAGLLLEALYLKAKCLQALDRISDATRECTHVLDTMEAAIPAGLPDDWGSTRLAEQLSRSVLLLPTLLLQSDHTSDALLAYRRALLRFSWCLASPDLVHIMRSFAALLLYAGVEAPRSTPPAHVENAFTPRNNAEEGILLLMILLRIMNKQQGYFDAAVFEHLTFALAVHGELETLAHHYEALLPGTLTRPARWYSLALCYSGSHPPRALSLLRQSLAPTERPGDVPALLLASKLCAAAPGLATESLDYADRALRHMDAAASRALKARVLHVKGVALRSRAVQLPPSAPTSGPRSGARDLRAALRDEARDALREAVALEGGDMAMVFDLGLVMAEMREWRWVVECGTRCLDFDSGGGGTEGRIQGWRLLALALSAQERYAEADAVLESALEETEPRERGPLLRTRARVLLALGEPVRAVQSYQALLGVVQAGESRRAAEAGGEPARKVGRAVEEAEVWHDLAQVYTRLEQWQDAETCLGKARSFDSYSVATWHNSGLLREQQGELEEAIRCYESALAIDTTHIDSKVKLGSLLWQVRGPSAFPVAKSFLNEALEADPTHVDAWYHMGMLQKAVGQKHEAARSFHAAVVQEQSSLVEKFASITPALLW